MCVWVRYPGVCGSDIQVCVGQISRCVCVLDINVCVVCAGFEDVMFAGAALSALSRGSSEVDGSGEQNRKWVIFFFMVISQQRNTNNNIIIMKARRLNADVSVLLVQL